jgi:hypothetical protein
MAVDKVIRFGLNVNRSLADVVNNTEALANLGVDIKDLDVIRNAAGTLGITSDDVRALSGLGVPLQTYLTKLYTDTQQYASIIDQTAGTTETLKGNLTINGQLAASSIKFQYVDNEDNTTLKYADISTSRISSWSSTGAAYTGQPDDEYPIFYGSAVEVDGPIITNEIELLDPAIEVRFRDSEVPTHKVEVEINGSTMYFYAMKGIPLVFDGFFRNFNSDLRLVTRGAVSWRVVNNVASYLTREYENVGGSNTTRSYLRYRDTKASSKTIEIYHNPNNILTLPLPAIGLEKLPAAELEGLKYLYIYRNLIKNMPDFTVFSPNLLLLDIRENNMELGGDSNLRKFNNNVLSRIPKSVTEIRMGNVFNGSITADLKPDTVTAGNFIPGRKYAILEINDGLGGADTDFTSIGAGSNALYEEFTATSAGTGTGSAADLTTGLPNLVTLNLNSHSRGGARNFYTRDADDPDGRLPEVHFTCRNYFVYRNGFDTIPDSIMELPTLRQIDLYSNSINEANFRIESDDIYFVRIGANPGINIPNLSNKTELDRFYTQYNRASGVGIDNNLLVTPTGDFKFENCSKNRYIYCYSNSFYGPIPKFKGCTALYYFNSMYSRLSGGTIIDGSLAEEGKEYSIFYNKNLSNTLAGSFIVGELYEITVVGDTDWVAIGATGGTAGELFTATGSGSGTGEAVKLEADVRPYGAATNNKDTVFTMDLSSGIPLPASVKLVDREYVLHEDLFDDCTAIQYFRLSSSFLLDKPLHPDLFAKTYNMRGIEVRSFNRGVSGTIPSFSSMQYLRYVIFLQNKFIGPVPSLFNNPSVYYMHLYQNNLSGTIPQISSTSMQYLYLHRNQLTGFIGLNTPNLRRFYCSYNQITGLVPDMNNLELCYDLYMNNNQFSGYVPGAIVGMRSLRRFDLSNNPLLTGTAISDLIADLVANYEANPRGGVTVNLANTTTATGAAVEQIELLRAAGWNIRN